MYNNLATGLKSRLFAIKEWIGKNSGDLALLGQFTLVALIFFGLGIIYAQNFIKEPPPVTIAEPAGNYSDSASTSTAIVTENSSSSKQSFNAKNALAQVGNFIASKNGETYYLTTCRNNIKEENKIYFPTEEDAKKAGFRPAKNCFK